MTRADGHALLCSALGAWSLALGASCASSDAPGAGPIDAGDAATTDGATDDAVDDRDAGPCHGDPARWAALTRGPIPCTRNSDCCVIVNGCSSETQVVAAAQRDEAKRAWPTCDDRCNACIPPPTEVGCANGTCTGTTVDFADAAPALMQDHCGVDGPAIVPSALHFGCGG